MSTTTQVRSPMTAGERYVLIALAMILAQLVLRGWAASGSWFYSDDLIFIGATAHGDADTHRQGGPGDGRDGSFAFHGQQGAHAYAT